MKKHADIIDALTAIGYLTEKGFCNAVGIKQGGKTKGALANIGIYSAVEIPERNKENIVTRRARLYHPADVEKAKRHFNQKQKKQPATQNTDADMPSLIKQIAQLQQQVAELQIEKQRGLF